jgi:alkylation response protein AidB-like acyl-CoA dehydrogenase
LLRLTQNTIGIPPVLNFGTPELQARVLPDVFAGKKFICLAISEAFAGALLTSTLVELPDPWAGSDVAGLQTTAVRDGDDWVISGTKKWITNGTFADYFSTGCRTEVRHLAPVGVLMAERDVSGRLHNHPHPA